MESGGQNNVEYERFGVQGITSKEANRLICWSIHYWWSSFYWCNQITIADFNEDLSGCEY